MKGYTNMSKVTIRALVVLVVSSLGWATGGGQPVLSDEEVTQVVEVVSGLVAGFTSLFLVVDTVAQRVFKKKEE